MFGLAALLPIGAALVTNGSVLPFVISATAVAVFVFDAGRQAGFEGGA